MADHRAIATVCEGVLHLLRMNYQPSDFDNELEFKVYLARDFTQPMAAGVSLFLFRVHVNGTHRTPTGHLGPNGQRFRPQLPLDLHLLLTAWGKAASLQHAILGWMMRALEDTPILPAGLLNALAPGAFREDETVEVVPAELSNEDLLRLWDGLVQNVYQISVPYIARNVRIESTRLITADAPVQQRGFDTEPHPPLFSTPRPR